MILFFVTIMTIDTTIQQKNFLYVNNEEPHAHRRKKILQKYPEIRLLMKPETMTKYIVLLSVSLQIAIARVCSGLPWYLFVPAAYTFGATLNHSLFLAIHEMSHNLAFESPAYNKILSVIANCPIGFPYCATFKDFHMQHHTCQGSNTIDTDIPSQFEGILITSRSYCYADRVLRKFVFIFFQIFAYALRPPCVNYSFPSSTWYLLLNLAVQLVFNIIVVSLGSLEMYFFLVASTFFAGGLHPLAGHFIAEHYTTDPKHETFSYYGILNIVSYNVGYHNEHHDFPTIPWSKLPLLRAIAPEFYNTLPQCSSWTYCIYDYIVNDDMGPYSRVKRK